MRPKTIVAIAGVLASLVVVLLVAFVGKSEATTAVATRNLYVSAVEWKGSASVAKEPYPAGAVPPGGGYESCPPGSQECDLKGDTTKWAVETYRFDTATIVAYAGERVVINAFGVNAAKHDIVAPKLKKSFTIYRGVVTKADLGVVNKPGIYRFLCITHPPAHQMDLVVLPKP
jgi:plastocyanin